MVSSAMAMENMMEVREELMISPVDGGKPTLRTAHFLKPMMTAELSSFPSTLSIPEIREVPFKVLFVGRKLPMKGWKYWVDRLKPSYQNIWEKAGIFEAILCSTYHILKDNELVLKLAERWHPETNTFVFSWGEATITLEDVMVLGGYSVLGDSVLSPLEDEHLIDMQNKLNNAHGVITQNFRQYATQYAWMNYFMGSGHSLEHEAFLVLWLSRYVFPSKYGHARKTVFPIALKLSRGISLALAPAVLGNIYRDLSLLKVTALANSDASQCKEIKLLLDAPFQLVQLWAWERFLTLRKEPKTINCGEPRIARWDNLSKQKVDNIGDVLDAAAGECIFQWRPYSTKLINWDFKFRNFYRDTPGYVLVDNMNTETESMVRCLRVSELVGLDFIEQYLPHRVALQFGYDQDLPGCVRRLNETSEIAWSNYIRPVRDVAIHTPGRLFEGDVTTRYLEWWNHLNSGKTAANVVLSSIPSNWQRVDEREEDYIDDDEVTLAEAFGIKKDKLTIADALLDPDEDNLSLAEFLNLKRVGRSQETLAFQDHEPLPTSKRLLFPADATDVTKSRLQAVGSGTETKLEPTMNESNPVEEREKVSVGTIQICKDYTIIREFKTASEFREINEQIEVLQRPNELRNRMMKLDYRIRILEMITADTKVDKIFQRFKKPM